MSLRDIKLPTDTVRLADASFTVRGMSLSDLNLLLAAHEGDLDRVFTLIADMADDPENGEASVPELIRLVIRTAPTLCGVLIATAADEPDLTEVAMSLPVMTQYEALQKIAALTFTEEGSLKKFLEVAVGQMASLRILIAKLAGSVDGSGA